jgi:hypothetical protein
VQSSKSTTKKSEREGETQAQLYKAYISTLKKQEKFGHSQSDDGKMIFAFVLCRRVIVLDLLLCHIHAVIFMTHDTCFILLYPSLPPSLPPHSNITTVTHTSSWICRRCPPLGRRFSVLSPMCCACATRTISSSTSAAAGVEGGREDGSSKEGLEGRKEGEGPWRACRCDHFWTVLTASSVDRRSHRPSEARTRKRSREGERTCEDMTGSPVM